MFKDKELLQLFTIEANLKYGELPTTLKATWNPYWGLYEEANELCKGGLSGDEAINHIVHSYISINGRLQKKCIFLQNEKQATWLKNFLLLKMKKNYPSISISIRKITSRELDYRRKKALDEAIENSSKIEILIQKHP